MIKKIIWLPTLFLSLALNQAAFAEKPMMSGPCSCPSKHKMWDELNLTPEQKAKIKEIKDQARSNMQANRQKLQNINAQIHEQVKTEKLDQDKLDKLIEQKKEILGNKIKNKVMIKHQIYGVLNEQQKQKLSSMMDQWQQKRNERMKQMDNMDDMNDNDNDND